MDSTISVVISVISHSKTLEVEKKRALACMHAQIRTIGTKLNLAAI